MSVALSDNTPVKERLFNLFKNFRRKGKTSKGGELKEERNNPSQPKERHKGYNGNLFKGRVELFRVFLCCNKVKAIPEENKKNGSKEEKEKIPYSQRAPFSIYCSIFRI